MKLRRYILPACALIGIIATIAVMERCSETATLRDSAETDAPCTSSPAVSSILLAGGAFQMGSDHHYREEAPVETMTVGALDIDTHEVTNAQFSAFVRATGYVTSAERAQELGFPDNGSAVFADAGWSFIAGANWRHPDGPDSSIDGKDNEPVVQVSLNDAKAYAQWAGRDLPTEAEWEFAARGGLTGEDFAWGDALTPGGKHMANTWQGPFPVMNTGSDGHMGRAPVGCFEPNGYGLHDMVGNVWEWTKDPYFPDRRLGRAEDTPDFERLRGYDPRQADIPVGVIKGGSFLCAPMACRRYRPAARHAQDTGMGTNHIGFRTVARPGEGQP